MAYYDQDEDEALNEFISSQAQRARPQLDYEEPLPAPERPSAADQLRSMKDDDSPWDAVTNYGIPAIAALLDTATNKGRGVGSILQSAGIQANQRAVGRRELAQDKLRYLDDDARRAQQQKMLDYNWASLANRQGQGWERINLQGEGLDLRKKAQDFALNPDNEQAQRGAAKTQELTGVDVNGLNSRQQGQMAPVVGRIQGAALAPETAGRVKQTQIDTELANHPRTEAAAASQAGAVADSTTRAKSAAERDIGASTPVANGSIENRDVWGALNDSQRSQALKTLESRNVFEHALATMMEIQKRAGVQNLPSGDKATYDAAHGAAVSQLSTLYNTGVISAEEYKRMSDRLPQSGGLKTSAAAAVGWATGQDNVVGDMLAGAGSETLKELDAKLSTFGLRGGGQQAPAPKPSAAQPPPTARGATGPMPQPSYPDGTPAPGGENLGVMGTRNPNSVPSFQPEPGAPRAKPGGMARMRTVIGPDGSPEQMSLTDEEAQYLMLQGAQRID